MYDTLTFSVHLFTNFVTRASEKFYITNQRSKTGDSFDPKQHVFDNQACVFK